MRQALTTVLALFCAPLDIGHAHTLEGAIDFHAHAAPDGTPRNEAQAIEAIGAATFALSSDLEQPPNPLHTDGLLALDRGLIAHGVSPADIDIMSRKNPARLLDLEP